MRQLREQPARVLANRPLEAAGEVFQRERAVSVQRPHRSEAERPCPWPAGPRSSWPQVVLPYDRVGCWGCVQRFPGPSQAQPR